MFAYAGRGSRYERSAYRCILGIDGLLERCQIWFDIHVEQDALRLTLFTGMDQVMLRDRVHVSKMTVQ